ncbi:hypothetical protein [Methanothrix sp.]|uniref:hypothetical protein n=1 Tax=Methanothrix sp. TaxID=90426 RepID=UPI0025E46937|nr:hypothetical protein [Methanothrix sp.]
MLSGEGFGGHVHRCLQGTIMFIGMAFLLLMTYSHLGGITISHQSLTDMAHLVPGNLP